MPKKTRILGLDPGLNKTGWGVVDASGGDPVSVAWGQVKPPPQMEFAARLSFLYKGLMAVIQDYAPDEAAVEETFVNQNPASALKLGMARGVVLLAPANLDIPVYHYGANKVKKAVVGAGHASKDQVIHMVTHLLRLQDSVQSDEADALAVALCHVQHRRLKALIP
ncbi:MAG: crossover junction endodeoxyribonuclease RuvC [Alphaproteobacteria bacterium]